MPDDETNSNMIKEAPNSVLERARILQEQAGQADFCSVNNAEHAPEVCNEFVTIYYLENSKTMGSKEDTIDLTRNICHWMFQESFTASRISMIKP